MDSDMPEVSQNTALQNAPTPTAKQAVSIFVPVYNESKRMAEKIGTLENFLQTLPIDFEIVIINDNSKDESATVAQQLASQNPNVTAISFDKGPSRRENLATSFGKARHDVVAFMDLDLSTDLAAFPALIDAVHKDATVAIGNRYDKESATQRSVRRLVYSRLYNGLIRFVFQSRFSDHQCGFKAFRKDTIVALVEELGYDNSYTRGWFWDAEMLIRAQRKGLTIAEVPVQWTEFNESTFQFWREVKLLLYMAKLRVRL